MDLDITEQVGGGENYSRPYPIHTPHTNVNFVMRHYGWLIAALLLAVLTKAALLVAGAVPFNSDEAVVALMARHILQGARPIFFYGQAYMGSLDAWLVAAVYKLLGEGVTAIRVVQAGLYASYLFSLWLLAKAVFKDGSVANFSVAVAAVPVVLTTTYTTASLGGYGETLVFGNLILWLGYKLLHTNWGERRAAWLALGLISGLAFWTLGLIVVYLLPVALLAIWQLMVNRVDRTRRLVRYAICGAGFFLGSMPWWYANFTGSWEAAGALLQPGVYQTSFVERLVAFFLIGLPTLLGIRYPWLGEISPLQIAFMFVILYLLVIALVWRSFSKGEPVFTAGAGRLLGLFCACFLLVFLLTRFGIDSTGRYLLPLYSILTFGLGLSATLLWRRRPVWGWVFLGLVLALNGFETARAAVSAEKITTQFDPITRFDNRYDRELIQFLTEEGELRGYTSYWVSFRLAFLSQEELIYAPGLPYKADLSYAPTDARIPKYDKEVKASDQVAYITSQHPRLDEILRREIISKQVVFSEKQIGPYHIFYNLFRPVHLEGVDWQSDPGIHEAH